MTKCIVLGEENEEQAAKKPIEFVKYLGRYSTIETCVHSSPSSCDNIELIAKNYLPNIDLMFAYDTNRSRGTLYLGHWNDGVVE